MQLDFYDKEIEKFVASDLDAIEEDSVVLQLMAANQYSQDHQDYKIQHYMVSFP